MPLANDLASSLREAERRLVEMVNRRADAEESEVRDDAAAKRERVRQDDLRFRDLQAEFQEDYRRFGAEPPLLRSDEWSADLRKKVGARPPAPSQSSFRSLRPSAPRRQPQRQCVPRDHSDGPRRGGLSV